MLHRGCGTDHCIDWDELRAVITDNNLAGTMSGATLAKYAGSRHREMTIVIMSGTIVKLMPANTTFLQKPFAP